MTDHAHAHLAASADARNTLAGKVAYTDRLSLCAMLVMYNVPAAFLSSTALLFHKPPTPLC
jgi:hypothetical protein